MSIVDTQKNSFNLKCLDETIKTQEKSPVAFSKYFSE